MRALLLTLGLLLAMPGHGQSAHADLRAPLARADAALAAQDYPAAYEAYAGHAADNPLAQFNLALFEQQGWGRPANPPAACAWFEQAAHHTIPAAQQFWGDCLAAGVTRAPNGPEALAWYAEAAASGIAGALCSAGDLYIQGTLVARDVARGLALCTAAAQQASLPAMVKLADYYRTSTDLPRARFWYSQAAQRHSLEAQWRLGVMLSEGTGGAAAPAEARFWFESAALEGYAPAYLPAAILYANAPLDTATGALAPADLARVYMWNQAARARTTNPQQLAEIARIDALVSAVMPEEWRLSLDSKVTRHLARHPAKPPAP
jgi:TPR repeat protein